MIMKKLFVVLLALTMVLSLTACNDKKSKPNNKDESQNPDLPTPSPSTAMPRLP